MNEVTYHFNYSNGHIVFVMKLADGLFQYNLPVYLSPEQWDDDAQLPVRETSHFDQKVYIIQQTRRSYLYALERLSKNQLKPTMVNLSQAWGKTLEKTGQGL